ncbi:MAG: LppM family (lipo)protein, partial [Brachybacterium sp.]
MNSISTRRRLLAVLLLPFLMVLAGCGKLHADFEITDADTVNAVFDIAVDTEFAEGLWDSAETFCSEMYSETLLDEDAPTVEP